MDSQSLQTNKMLEQALVYINRASVIPVGRDKKPLVSWKEFQTRKATKEEITDWWTKYPEANIGFITGKISNIAVVDVEKGGSVEYLPKTVIAKTGGGGWHYYYEYVDGIENKARIRPLTDIRGEGGYVVAPPSIHQSGEKYEWIETKIAIQPFPKHLFGIKEQSDWTEVAQGAGEGQRNETSAKYIGKLMSMFSQETWENTVWETARLWNEKNNPPLPERELRTTYESIKRKAITNPRKKELTCEEVEFVSFKEVLLSAIDELQTIEEKDILSFGYDWLDEKLTGFFKGELVVLGGETGSGKTTFATNMIYKAGENHKCAVFALEDRLNDYGIKKLYFEIGKLRKQEGKNNYYWNDYRKGRFKETPEFLSYLDRAYSNLKSDNIYFAKIEKQMNIDILEELIKQKTEEGYELFLVDHLHYFDLLKGESSKADYIEQVMVRMKTVLTNTGARMILVVHYKKLEGKKPTLDSFKDSISIVQNANYTISLWRDRTTEIQEDRFKTTFFIPKARNPNGEGTIEATFDPTTNDYKTISKWSCGTNNYPREVNINNI
jgi:replicative DNA helicase